MKPDKNSSLYKIRHSAAHLLAQAVKQLFPETKVTFGPVTEYGFFYDLATKETIKKSDLPRIEKRMKRLASLNVEIVGEVVSKDRARELYSDNPYKQEIINRIPAEKVSIYHQGDFFDLCEGNHTKTTGEVQHFKLTTLSGSYWAGECQEKQLQRVAGIAFETAQELEEHITRVELAKRYDHRLLGKSLDLFFFAEEAPGMPFFTPKGRIVYEELITFARSVQEEFGYQELKTPLAMKEELWRTSGHYENFKENMFFVTAGDDEKYALRPMNCPSAMVFYSQKQHSYKELPLRIGEFGQVHRYELSGVMQGLFRTRFFTQDDAHVFCAQDQVQSEVELILDMTKKVYSRFGFENFSVAISTRPEKSIGTAEQWNSAIDSLKSALAAKGYDFVINEGEGAFYGPKIEILIKDTLGREWQCGTIQVDFALPERFKLTYVDSDQSRKTPVVIHRVIYGSLERFFGILLESSKGKLPFWLAPVQIKVLCITSKQNDYAKKVTASIKSAGFRVELDDSAEKISAKIRQAQLEQVPHMIILGAQEEESKTVSLRNRDGKQQSDLRLDLWLSEL